jgi:uncharacterized protein with HEPN domain
MKWQHDIPQSLTDIITSIDAIEGYLARTMGERRDFNVYMDDRMLRSAVERELGIIGEATGRIHRVDPAYPILHNRKIIALRNRVVHAYDALDDARVWAIITRHLPLLRTEVEKLLAAQ